MSSLGPVLSYIITNFSPCSLPLSRLARIQRRRDDRQGFLARVLWGYKNRIYPTGPIFG